MGFKELPWGYFACERIGEGKPIGTETLYIDRGRFYGT